MSSTAEGTVICPVCLTHFTRKTHLDRHLRAHLDQRIYSCTNCNKASFTRSDLLTRHSRRCTQRDKGKAPSRKRSCEACIQRKIKCDLQHPCSKCAARGDKCVYDIPSKASAAEDSPTTLPTTSTLTAGSIIGTITGTNSAIAAKDTGSSLPVDAEEQLRIPLEAELSSYPGSAIISNLDANSSDLTSTGGGSLIGTFTLLPQDANTPELVADLNFDIFGQGSDTGTSTLFHGFVGAWYDDASLSTSTSTPSSTSTLASTPVPRLLPPADYEFTESTIDEFTKRQYVSHFLRIHCIRYPFLHLPTWPEATTHPLLLRVMVACGSLYAAGKDMAELTIPRIRVVEEILQSDVRHQIFRAFLILPGDDIDNQIQLSLSILTIQILGMFHWDPIERSVSAGHHGMTVAMLKQSSLLAYYTNWQPPSLSTMSQHPDECWRSWVRYETIKRIVLLSYLHDALMPIFYNLTCIMQEKEIDIRFPCAHTLWSAPNAEQWSILALATGELEDLRGRTVLSAAQVLFDPAAPTQPMDIFEGFVMIHFLLRVLSYPSTMQQEEKGRTIQRALQRWHAARLANPPSNDTINNITAATLPLYWLALVIQGERRNGSPPSRGEERFEIVKKWLWEFWPLLRAERGGCMEYILPENVSISSFSPPGRGIVDWVPDPPGQ